MAKKDVASFASDLMSLVKELAKDSKNPKIQEKIQELDKKKDEVLGGMKTIGPCFGCKESATVSSKDFDFKKAQWFMCPHGDSFCPDCLKKGAKDAREKRKADKEKAKKDGSKKK